MRRLLVFIVFLAVLGVLHWCWLKDGKPKTNSEPKGTKQKQPSRLTVKTTKTPPVRI
jgi:hypothetical protein